IAACGKARSNGCGNGLGRTRWICCAAHVFDIAAMVDPVGGGQARAQQFTRPLCRPGELEAAWRAAGFENVVPTTVMTRMAFADFDDFWTPYLGRQAGGAAYVATLSDGQREKLKE